MFKSSALPCATNIYTRHALRERQLWKNRRTQLLDKNTTHMLFKLASKYRPETRKENKLRRKAKKAAAAAAVNATNECDCVGQE
ncbi:hypothetical protein BGZ96_000282 [Linnemannia gamsii]|uniref:60S ribosomal protein L29 n=1 Tax=Linnemannia gamsii TaxID=64522 RepID=A0ABQ7KAT1_9FUNG|nr:hypothetical protein BGZ96_000282 [Linnemannia gamsii]